jgi:hypothetical protein
MFCVPLPISTREVCQMEKMEWDELSAAADAGMQGQGKEAE